jgi:hypothetical protein
VTGEDVVCDRWSLLHVRRQLLIQRSSRLKRGIGEGEKMIGSMRIESVSVPVFRLVQGSKGVRIS